MQETGTVVETQKNRAKVIIDRQEACSGCTHCSSTSDGRQMIVRVNNDMGARKGDTVLISSRDINPVVDGFKVFILPLVLFIVAYVIADRFVATHFAILIGIFLFSLPFVYMRVNKSKYQMYIEKVMSDPRQRISGEATDLA